MKRAAIARSACMAALLAGLGAGEARAQQAADYQGIPYDAAPLASVDLATHEGTALMQAQWRYSDTRIVQVAFYDPGADGQPGSRGNMTYDILPKAGARDFDDASWEAIDSATLSKPRGHGHLGFNWYRVRLTVPERVGGVDTTGSTVVFETQVDDYAEVWVDGELPHPTGVAGGPVVMGWNAANRLVIGRDVKPGQQIQLAVFGINGPISKSPTNFIFLHYAKLEFHRGTRGPVGVVPHEVNVDVVRLDPAIDAIVPANPKLWKLAEGFKFTEGPVWVSNGGYLLFSDPNSNTIYRWKDGELSIYRSPSGYSGADIAEYGQPGSNGLTLDAQGRLTINEHGNHRVSRVEADGSDTVLADSYQGKRLNSPNDLVYKSDDAVYFTDPPFGLPKFFDDPRKELPFSGVFRWKDGEVTLLSTDLTGPNGIAFSPDEKYLYVGDWDDKRKVVMRYSVRPDGTLGAGEVFHDFTADPGEDAIDGIKVDVHGQCVRVGAGRIVDPVAAGQSAGNREGAAPSAQHDLG